MRFPLNFLGFKIDRKQQEVYQTVTPQTRASWEGSWNSIFGGLQGESNKMNFYDRLRAEIPILDLAPIKINRLIGDFDIEAENQSIQKDLELFKEQVTVGSGGLGIGRPLIRGWHNYQYQMCDSAVSKGLAFSEIVPYLSYKDIAYLKVPKANTFRFIKRDDGSLSMGQVQDGNYRPVEFLAPEYIQYLAFDLRDGDPRGKSLFHSLQFVSQIFFRIEKAFENTTWRIGEPTFVVKIKGDKHGQTAELNKIGSGFQTQLSNSLQLKRRGQTADIFAPLPDGITLDIDILGDGKFIEHVETPLNLIVDQIVGKTGLPHWMLGIRRKEGFNSSLSEVEADMITADIAWNRKQLDPIIQQIFDMHLILTGRYGNKWKHVWRPISLRDDKTMAEARKANAEAEAKELETIITLDSWGAYTSQEEVEETLREHNLIKYLPKDKESRRRWWEMKVQERLAKDIYNEYI